MRVRKIPVEVEAVQWTGDNFNEIKDFVVHDLFIDGKGIGIKTLEGNMYASIGDFIIKGINGEFYPCKEDIFWKTYEVVY